MTDFSDPLAVVRAAIRILNTEDWKAAAALVDPVSLEVFVRNIRERFAPAHPPTTVTADEYMQGDPQLPRAVAEHYAAEARRHADPMLRLQQELPGVDSVDTLRVLPSQEVLARWLDGRSARRQIERLAAVGRISARDAAVRASADFAMYRYVPIGVVPDGSQFAHVLYRHDVDPEQPWSGDLATWLASRPMDEQAFARELWVRGHPSVAIVRRQADNTWRIVVEHDFLNMSSLHVTGVGSRAADAEPDALGT